MNVSAPVPLKQTNFNKNTGIFNRILLSSDRTKAYKTMYARFSRRGLLKQRNWASNRIQNCIFMKFK